MKVRIERFTADHLAALRAYSAIVWPERPRTDAFMRWRYLEYPRFEGLVAMRGETCVGSLFAFHRTYLWGGVEVEVLEGHDWWVLPDSRGHKIGERLLQTLMDRPQPQVLWGGSKDSQYHMPRLGWSRLDFTHELILPLGGARLAARLTGTHRFTEALGGLSRRLTHQLFRFAPNHAPPRGQVVPLRTLDDTYLDAIRETDTFGPLTSAGFLQWLQKSPPDQGVLLPLGFTLDGERVGWSLARVVHTRGGMEGVILDAWSKDPSLYSWIIRRTIGATLPWQPDRIAVRTGEGPLLNALRSMGFLPRAKVQICAWHPGLDRPTRPSRPTRLCTDLPLGPYG